MIEVISRFNQILMANKVRECKIKWYLPTLGPLDEKILIS